MLVGDRFDPACMQTGVGGRALSSDIPTAVHELRDVASAAKPFFDREVSRIANECKMPTLAKDDLAAAGFRGLALARLKGDNDNCERCIQKCKDKYQPEVDRGTRPGPAVAWLIDVVRCSFVCADPYEIRKVLDAIEASEVFKVVRVKVRPLCASACRWCPLALFCASLYTATRQ